MENKLPTLLEKIGSYDSSGAGGYRNHWIWKKDDEDNQNDFTIYYKDLQIKEINKVFKDFRLVWILKRTNGLVDFAIKPTVINPLWDNYSCGFYYTRNDKPTDMWHGRETQETEFEDEFELWFRYWYRTEKITDNWWFYETKTYPISR